jgi:cystathionine gamma-synthase
LIGIDDNYEEGDVCWLETPLNPTGEVRNIKHYADKAHAKGVKVVVDATFGPPPLQDPFKWGADIVVHSGE